MSKVFLIGHTGSINRGCEAIVRSTVKLLEGAGIKDIYLLSYDKAYDSKLGVDKIANYMLYHKFSKYSPTKYLMAALKKVNKQSRLREKFRLKPMLDILEKDDVVMVIGGDTYCYSKPYSIFAGNCVIKKKGAKLVLWSCSVGDEFIDKDMIADFNNYDYIFPREIKTYENLVKCGVSEDKLILMSDSAFNLDTKYVKGYDDIKNTVGINISPIVVKSEKSVKAIDCLIEYILNETDKNILFIPHVYKENYQDHKELKKLFDKYNKDSRVGLVEECYTCEELKYIISKCDLFVGARTHSTIAAYSSLVPTLVLGYSVKSQGIATDLFGTDEDFVLHYKNIEEPDEIKNAFAKLIENEEKVRKMLTDIMPRYAGKGVDAAEKIAELAGKSEETRVYHSPLSCSGCGACVEACPKNCITMREDEKGFSYPHIDMDKCIRCDMCRKTCPVRNPLEKSGILSVNAVYTKDDELRKASSSGGVFGMLADKILEEGGIVCGAGYDDDFNVVHKIVDNQTDLVELYGSKYVQSRIGNVYSEIKQVLDGGRRVLFAGTPCQVGGLKAYLKKDYETLLTMDFICHGVPSPLAWRKYLDLRQKEAGAKVKSVSFRAKDYGWKKFSLKIEFENGKTHVGKIGEDKYLRSFIEDISLRESCTSCAFKTREGVSDITVADFWGIEKMDEFCSDGEFYNDKGVSMVVVRNEKAKAVFDSLDNMVKAETSADVAFSKNKSIDYSVKANLLADKFFCDIKKKNFDKVSDKYCGEQFSAKVRRKLGKRG